MLLSECLFNEDRPQALVVRDFLKGSRSPIVRRDIVVNDHSHWNAQAVEVKTVNSLVVEFWVHEEVLKLDRSFDCHILHAAEEPAVTKSTLVERVPVKTTFTPK